MAPLPGLDFMLTSIASTVCFCHSILEISKSRSITVSLQRLDCPRWLTEGSSDLIVLPAKKFDLGPSQQDFR